MFRYNATEVLGLIKENDKVYEANLLNTVDLENDSQSFKLPLPKVNQFEIEFRRLVFGEKQSSSLKNTVSINNQLIEFKKDESPTAKLAELLGPENYATFKNSFVQSSLKMLHELLKNYLIDHESNLGIPQYHLNIVTDSKPIQLQISLANIPLVGTPNSNWPYKHKDDHSFLPLYISDPVTLTYEVSGNSAKQLKFVELATASPIIQAFLQKKFEQGFELTLMQGASFDSLDKSKLKKPCLIKAEQGYKMWGYKGNEWQLTDVKIDNAELPFEWKPDHRVYLSPKSAVFPKLKITHTPIPNFKKYASVLGLREMPRDVVQQLIAKNLEKKEEKQAPKQKGKLQKIPDINHFPFQFFYGDIQQLSEAFPAQEPGLFYSRPMQPNWYAELSGTQLTLDVLRLIRVNGYEIDDKACVEYSSESQDTTRAINFTQELLGANFREVHQHYYQSMGTFPSSIFINCILPSLEKAGFSLEHKQVSHDNKDTKDHHVTIIKKGYLIQVQVVSQFTLKHDNKPDEQVTLSACYQLENFDNKKRGFVLTRFATDNPLINDIIQAHSNAPFWIYNRIAAAFKQIINPDNNKTNIKSFLGIPNYDFTNTHKGWRWAVTGINNVLKATFATIVIPFIAIKNTLKLVGEGIPAVVQVIGTSLYDLGKNYFRKPRKERSLLGTILAASSIGMGSVLAVAGTVSRYAARFVFSPKRMADESHKAGTQVGRWFGFSEEGANNIGRAFSAGSWVISTLAYTGLALLALPAAPAIGAYLAAKGTFTATISSWASNVGIALKSSLGAFSLLGPSTAQAGGIGIGITFAALVGKGLTALSDTVKVLTAIPKSPKNNKSKVDSTATTVKSSNNDNGSSPEDSPRSSENGNSAKVERDKNDSGEEISPPGTPDPLNKKIPFSKGPTLTQAGTTFGQKSKTPSPTISPIQELEANKDNIVTRQLTA